jgi:hypothetical protein
MFGGGAAGRAGTYGDRAGAAGWMFGWDGDGMVAGCGGVNGAPWAGTAEICEAGEGAAVGPRRAGGD